MAPNAVPHGAHAELVPTQLSPRTPTGPSDTLSATMPRRSTPWPCHMSTPAVSDAFSSKLQLREQLLDPFTHLVPQIGESVGAR